MFVKHIQERVDVDKSKTEGDNVLQQIWGQQKKTAAVDGGDRWVECHGKDLVNR